MSPLTAAEKFKVVTRSAFDYAQFLWYGALAGIGQAETTKQGMGKERRATRSATDRPSATAPSKTFPPEPSSHLSCIRILVISS